jgi:lauroyl/myristoyl acyltransferase
MSQPMSFVVRPLDNPLLDALATRMRQMSGNQVIGRHISDEEAPCCCYSITCVDASRC